MRVSKDIPLSEITFRKYERPGKLKERDLVKKLCLSLGLLQPGDSRDVIVDVFHVLLKAKKRKLALTVAEIEKKVIQNRKLHKAPMAGVASSNLRRQIKRLKDLFIIEKVGKYYRITDFADFSEIFHEKIESFVLQNILNRVNEYVVALDENFS